ncbi:alpha/beta fold hydrolase [Deinococcus cavernae]|uniref:Alpha/beta fold hydrolase n=1 Tax=Deinococcus cavernae TaxID=2320857 RepID=A0A418VII4_9DEIO|nr:alpha/beta fold hydrolase [Deinococcus cavernae]RJF75941.1 alpha/beta fold hydrolase [Deinococcus cavernae]
MKPSRRLSRPRPPFLVLFVLGLSGTAVVAVGWHFADALVWASPVRRRIPTTRILGVQGVQRLAPGPGLPVPSPQVILTRNPATTHAGVLGLEWNDPDGLQFFAQLGPVLTRTRRTVVRAVRWQEAALTVGQTVRPTTVGLGTPASRGLAYQDVLVPAPHGPMPAWLVPGSPDGAVDTDWVIVTHGYRGLRQDALRVLPTFAGLGLTSLAITYRNAHGAPRTPQGVYRLSAEEWEDLEAAVRFAQAHGARKIVLMGFSMGGGITLAFLRYSALASRIAGVVLDSPPLEWRSLIRHFARRYYVRPFARLVESLTVLKSGQDFDAVDHLSVMHQFQTPMLLFHGSADRTVPVEQVERFAHARPDIVEYHRVEGAEHIRSWNMNPEWYEATLTRFLRRVLAAKAGAGNHRG